VSVSDERSALDTPISPDTPPAERKAALTALLREFFGNPAMSAQALHDRSVELPINGFDLTRILDELAPTPSKRQLDTARWLITNATGQGAMLVGLGLLRGNAERRDIPLLRTVGLLRYVDRFAVEVMLTIPDAVDDVIWLVERSRDLVRNFAAKELVDHPDPVMRDWVRSTPPHLLSGETARRIAEQHGLAAMLDAATVDDVLWDQTGHLLIAMTDTDNYQTQIGRYADARTVYQRWIALAGQRPATVDRAALLTTVADDLATGLAAPVVADLRTELISKIDTLLSTPPWSDIVDKALCSADPVAVRRAGWIRKRRARIDIPTSGFAIRIVPPDPYPHCHTDVETRIMIDGMPAVATAFDKGPAEPPGSLLDRGQLRATNTPAEVRLAEAYCTEGCCGGLYVTIVREGAEVVWRGWRSSMRDDPPADVRFNAAEYDREVARAEQDHQWEWPAHTLARLIGGQLMADRTILDRWDCRLDWFGARPRESDTARLSFTYPVDTDSFEDPFIQFDLAINVNGREPAALAEEIIATMRTTDPKHTAETISGSRELIRKLGLG
jgi:hypothetical protein